MQFEILHLLWFLLIGLAAGWLAGQILKGGGFGLWGDLIVGVIGALLGGFLFGFDTAVISGAEQAIQKYWALSDLEHGFTISIALIGTVTGAFLGRIPADSLGRKRSLIIIALIFLFSSLGTAVATNWYLFVILRFIGGLGVGAHFRQLLG